MDIFEKRFEILIKFIDLFLNNFTIITAPFSEFFSEFKSYVKLIYFHTPG